MTSFPASCVQQYVASDPPCFSHVPPKEIANFVDRCHAVALNLVQQLASLYHGKSTGLLGAFSVGGSGPPPQPSLQAHLFSSVAALGALLAVLVTLDQVVTQNECLREAWGAYKGMIAYARADPAAFQASEVRSIPTSPAFQA